MFDGLNWLWTIIVGGIAGWLADMVVPGVKVGVLGAIIAGILGGLLGGWLFGRVKSNDNVTERPPLVQMIMLLKVL